ncbi:MAG: argininosuccinate lyase [Phycisphaera sp.]|nr:argininosuccinate lyase [Phycisphaera sp.]
MPPHKPNTSSPAPGPKPWEHAKPTGSGSAQDELATRFVESLSYDRRLYTHDITGSIAHARMLRKVGLISVKDLAAIEKGLASIRKEIDKQGDAWPGWKIELEDVHMCIEAALIEKVGDAGRKLHTGRSRNDQVALDLKLWVADAVNELDKVFAQVFRGFVLLAQRDGAIVMPSYTHLQRAQPIVVGGEIMAWLAALERCQRRLHALRLLNSDNPLGSGAIAGSCLPLDRKATADQLDALVGPTFNAIDATASRDAALDMAYALAVTAMTLSRWAEQWIIYASTEFSFITLDGRYTTGSSMMPQKRNPDMLELTRGRTGTAYGSLVALLTMCKGITVGYNRDLQEDKRHLFAAYDSVRDSLEMCARIASTTKFNEKTITASLGRGFLDATALAEYLVVRGVPFRTAHQIVGSLVRLCEERNLHELSQLKLEDFNHACAQAKHPRACQSDVYDWLGAANVVKRYRSAGNAGVSGFEIQLKQWDKRLS